MTENEYETFYYMGKTRFAKLTNPTLEQCLVWLRSYKTEIIPQRINYIPKKHREFCKIQLKLEGLL